MKAVIFDLDGVITDTAELHFLAWKRIAEQLHIPFDRDFNERLKGISREESLERILDHGGLSATYSKSAKRDLLVMKNQYYQKLIDNITPRDLLPGIGRLLCELEKKRIKIALASASRNAPSILKRLDLINVFDVIVDPASLKKGKPDPEIFLAAAGHLGVSPVDCAGIEDAEAGIASIKSAGMFAVGVGNERAMHEADLSVRQTSDLSFDLLYEGWKRRMER
ncbi:beta-phosphoglucomutase [Bacillus sonorensis]|uniref:beta-phosphoglucomutase n=1 Tax=Bacillus sonorensis TaxID=119858 RepID=UPI002282224C|nr:beta-phosphoglucomutase [Bacillus sonorensis]